MVQVSTHLHKKDIACKCGCGKNYLDPLLIDLLEKLALYFNRQILVYVGASCEKHHYVLNCSIAHISGNAVDFSIPGVRSHDVADVLRGFTNECEIISYRTFVHVEKALGKTKRGVT